MRYFLRAGTAWNTGHEIRWYMPPLFLDEIAAELLS
jgi:hypothetical protein